LILHFLKSLNKMNVADIIKNLQENCDKYLEKNSLDILNTIQNELIPVTDSLKDFKVQNISPNSWGVYCFHIKFRQPISTFAELESIWQTNLAGERLICPKPIKTRFKPLEQNKWHCFYVGKSETLASRISQHIHQKTRETTYGLKLSDHDRLINLCEFTYSSYTLSVNPKAQKDGLKCLVVTIEKFLREELKPLIGKQ
jgi:hypothetical protein